MKLRPKILSGFLVLALMLSVAGVWSIYELRSISSGVQRLLRDNYRSINSAKTMAEALEREDSGILLLLLGKWDEGRGILAAADSLFDAAYTAAANNVTIPGESDRIRNIDEKYRAYRAIWQRPIVDTQREGSLTWYFETVRGAFLDVKSAVNELTALNDRVMFETASLLRDEANRAVMPGIVAVLAALAFSGMFSYFVNLYMVRPIERITESVKQTVDRGERFDVRLETRDELSDLAVSIRRLVARIEQGHRDERS